MKLADDVHNTHFNLPLVLLSRAELPRARADLSSNPVEWIRIQDQRIRSRRSLYKSGQSVSKRFEGATLPGTF
jgi:hypothetical protein